MGARTLVTFEEFQQLPDWTGKRELLRGEVIELPPADLKHHLRGERLFVILRSALGQLKAGVEGGRLRDVHYEMGYKMTAGGWLIPDVSITHANQPAGKYLLGAPALAVEIVSESNTAEMIAAKIEDYLANGAIQVWVVYPGLRHMWIHEKGRAEQRSGKFAVALLPGLELDLDEIPGE